MSPLDIAYQQQKEKYLQSSMDKYSKNTIEDYEWRIEEQYSWRDDDSSYTFAVYRTRKSKLSNLQPPLLVKRTYIPDFQYPHTKVNQCYVCKRFGKTNFVYRSNYLSNLLERIDKSYRYHIGHDFACLNCNNFLSKQWHKEMLLDEIRKQINRIPKSKSQIQKAKMGHKIFSPQINAFHT